MTDRKSEDDSVDPMPLVQYVLRESYQQATEDLRYYAEKVRYFNERQEGSPRVPCGAYDASGQP